MKKEKSFQDLSVEDKLFVLQMVTKIINLDNPADAEKIGKDNPLMGYARKIVDLVTSDKHFDKGSLIALNSTTEVIAEYENVLVKVPLQPNSSPSRHILAYSPGLGTANALAVPSHSYFGYEMKRMPDGTAKPTVTVHFYGLPEEKLGKKICAKVAIKSQTNILTGDKKMVIDVTYTPSDTRPTLELSMGADIAAKENEFVIPEMPEKCVRIKTIPTRNEYPPIGMAPIASARETANV